MWFWIIPLLVIFYLGMAFAAGVVYIMATHDRLDPGDDTYIGYTIAAFFWPVCLPLCLIFCAARSTGTMWTAYMGFLERFYDKRHPEMTTVRKVEQSKRGYY